MPVVSSGPTLHHHDYVTGQSIYWSALVKANSTLILLKIGRSAPVAVLFVFGVFPTKPTDFVLQQRIFTLYYWKLYWKHLSCILDVCESDIEEVATRRATFCSNVSCKSTNDPRFRWRFPKCS